MSIAALPPQDDTTPEPVLQPIRVLPIPDHRPPPVMVTPEARSLLTAVVGERYVQEQLDVDFDVDDEPLRPRHTCRSDLPDPRHWAAHLAQALVEIMAGSRPAPQVVRWTTPEVYAVVARHAAVSARRGRTGARRTRVRSVRVCEPADGVAEACAVVIDGTRVRALAMRMVGLDGRWHVEALQVG